MVARALTTEYGTGRSRCKGEPQLPKQWLMGQGPPPGMKEGQGRSGGQGVVVARLPPKEEARVRFPLAAPCDRETAPVSRGGCSCSRVGLLGWRA
jgi:hypothetical protein